MRRAAVAQRVGISKRTFYHRFSGKRTLFAAVVHRIIERLRPPADSQLIEGGDLQEVLERLAALILKAALSPQAIALHRLIVAETARFPELVDVFAREGAAEEATTFIAEALEREMDGGRLRLYDTLFAAPADGYHRPPAPRYGPGQAHEHSRAHRMAAEGGGFIFARLQRQLRRLSPHVALGP